MQTKVRQCTDAIIVLRLLERTIEDGGMKCAAGELSEQRSGDRNRKTRDVSLGEQYVKNIIILMEINRNI